MDLNITSILAVVVFSSIATAVDLKHRRIPNWLTLTAGVLGLLFHVFTGGWGGLLTSIGGFATGFGILLTLWLIGGGGGGDVKLMGAIGAWLGAFPTLIVFLASAGFAVLCSVAMIVLSGYRQANQPEADSGQPDAAGPAKPLMKQSVPYALPVAMSIWTLWLVHATGF